MKLRPPFLSRSGARLADAEARVRAALADERGLKSLVDAPGRDARGEDARVAKEIAASFSGMAFWPALVMDDGGEAGAPSVITSRGPQGEHQKSHWQTVLTLMTPSPIPVAPGDSIRVQYTVELPSSVTAASKYALEGTIS